MYMIGIRLLRRRLRDGGGLYLNPKRRIRRAGKEGMRGRRKAGAEKDEVVRHRARGKEMLFLKMKVKMYAVVVEDEATADEDGDEGGGEVGGVGVEGTGEVWIWH